MKSLFPEHRPARLPLHSFIHQSVKRHNFVFFVQAHPGHVLAVSVCLVWARADMPPRIVCKHLETRMSCNEILMEDESHFVWWCFCKNTFCSVVFFPVTELMIYGVSRLTFLLLYLIPFRVRGNIDLFQRTRPGKKCLSRLLLNFKGTVHPPVEMNETAVPNTACLCPVCHQIVGK